MEITIFYEENEELQEKRRIDHLISLYNAQELFIEDENSNMINFHKASIDTLKFVINMSQGRIKTDFNTVFIKLLNIRLSRLIEIQEESAKRLRKLYENGELRWMDDPFNKLISEMNIGLLNNNLTRLREGYYKKECKGLDNTWIKILEKELKSKKQAESMKSKMWPSSDGLIHVEKMSTTHINNCIQRLMNGTKKDSFGFNWLGIFYDELDRRRSIEETIRLQEERNRQEEERQREIAFAAKVWEAYNNRDLIVEICGDADAIVQDLSVKQLNYGIREFEDDTMIAILRKELETRNSACLDNYDNDKLYLYGRNVSYMNLTNVSDGINAIKKNPENYLENLLECLEHRRKVILFNRLEYETIKEYSIDLTTWELARLEELCEELKCSNDPIEKELYTLYADAIVAVEEKEEEKRVNANRQAEKAYNFAKRYGAHRSTLKKINPEMYEKDLKELLNILRTFRI